jgi:LasA protease
MHFSNHRLKKAFLSSLFGIILLISACVPTGGATEAPANPSAATAQPPIVEATPLPTRPPYQPGELVDYIAQTGDNLPALAVHFNTTVKEIMTANPIIPQDVTTLPPGMPMKIPIYYKALWGNPFHILPDSLFVNGPAQVGFNTVDFVNSKPGWFKNHQEYIEGKTYVGGQIIDFLAEYYSVSPRVLLAVLDYQTGVISKSDPEPANLDFILNNTDNNFRGFLNQLVWMTNMLNNGYYGWRTGKIIQLEHLDGRLEIPDPWQNAATVAFQNYFNHFLDGKAYDQAIYSDGLYKTYVELFGDPFANVQPHIPGSLQQPPFHFPFQAGEIWAYTGGPHTGWGTGDPFSAIDFAPPSTVHGCFPSDIWARAVADGVITRVEPAVVFLDLDGDGDEHTGWVVFYLHLATDSIQVHVGQKVKAGDLLGHPSCEGGEATGSHVHIARKYNGEWIPAGGIPALNMDGWVVVSSGEAYQGSLQRQGHIIQACTCSDQSSQVQAGSTP